MSPAGLKDIFVEAAITTIQDCEDSVAAVDAADKVGVYRNWLGLMKGDLEDRFEKGGRRSRAASNPTAATPDPDGNPDAAGPQPDAGAQRRPPDDHQRGAGRDGARGAGGHPRRHGHGAVRDARPARRHAMRNSRSGSIYIVKPKMHGPEEVAFTCELFDRGRGRAGPAAHTMKVGIMDEERRTTVNLKECIRAARRVVFINTGFLDRTGDEIHTSMEAGPVLPKEIIKGSRGSCLRRLERRHRPGLRLPRPAQIGKGMWAMPDEMKAMLESKIAHPQAGANCAWVPSPTAATLHATTTTGYSVSDRQQELMSRGRASLDDILTPPLLGDGPNEPKRSRPSWTTTPRASSATSCAGSTRASAAPRCPTSRRRPDGGPRHAAHLQPAHRQLAAPRHLQRGSRCGDPAAHGRGSTGRTPAIRSTATWRRFR
jgi:malate synthase